MKLIILLLLVVAPVMSFAATPVTERILGFNLDRSGITYQVFSSGCTRKADFSVLQLETFPVQLKLVRNSPDLCKAWLPYGTEVKFTWEELGLKNGRAIMANPIQPLFIGN